ncbi:single-stranded DNA-binding protein [Streptomyces sp. OfavH-34-F]|uniref:single-stranded DNA-binding protein n=1 Tax=unclassified Streptomyces TaxID=2593676 RepID=UPI001EF24490|nr:single-stranded DNA-binding protein [Streptomyces sp. OfavH-34-F]MCG7528142.1 single-stranded DNA-binding protein [Streptomyces sp. OfavH-34-F]
MNETLVTLVGNAATAVEFRETATGGMARFRFAVTPRRWDRAKEAWADGHTSFYTVWAWRTLAANLAGSVSVGEPLVVHGRLKVREEEVDGQRRTFVDIEAVAVGHDLTRGTAAFRRALRNDPAPASRFGPAPVAAGDDPWAVREAPQERDEGVAGERTEGPARDGAAARPEEPPAEDRTEDRAERPAPRRRTVRQKTAAAPRKKESDLVAAR